MFCCTGNTNMYARKSNASVAIMHYAGMISKRRPKIGHFGRKTPRIIEKGILKAPKFEIPNIKIKECKWLVFRPDLRRNVSELTTGVCAKSLFVPKKGQKSTRVVSASFATCCPHFVVHKQWSPLASMVTGSFMAQAGQAVAIGALLCTSDFLASKALHRTWYHAEHFSVSQFQAWMWIILTHTLRPPCSPPPPLQSPFQAMKT